MSDGGEVQDALTRAAGRRAERNRLSSRLASLQQEVEAAAAKLAGARCELSEEEKDVAKLESFSPTRIWASLRDTRLTDLDRERAQRDKAAYAVAEAESRHGALARELSAVESELAGYADVDAEYSAALDGKADWIRESGAAGAGELSDIALEKGELGARDRELDEALRAAVQAQQLLAASGDLLGRARDWSTWDAFGGGGFFTDMMKYDRLDDATATLRRANAALEALSRELADVNLAPVQGAGISGLLEGFDVWFDNIFSDLSVRSRIVDTHDRVRAVSGEVAEVHDALVDEIRRVRADLDRLEERRLELLVG